MKQTYLLLLLVVVAMAGFQTAWSIPSVKVSIPSNGAYQITVNGQVWFTSGDISFRANNEVYSISGKTLMLKQVATFAGTDKFGTYQATNWIWTTSNNTNQWGTTIKVYSSLVIDPPGMAHTAVGFEQTWLTAAENTTASNKDAVISSFPSFVLNDPSYTASLGFLSYGEIFVEEQFGQWSGTGKSPSFSYTGSTSGPLMLFDTTATVSAIVSPSSQFMSTSMYQTNNQIQWGTMGAAESIPAGFSSSTFIYFDDVSATETVLGLGSLLLRAYGKMRENAYTEFTTKYLGYNTDNGAYYYYNTEPSKTYEDTLLNVKEYALSEGIPYQWLWLDSWWYYKQPGPNPASPAGVTNWTSMPWVFPTGLNDFHDKLNWPFVAHNRYWSPETVYARQNGGNYDFIVEKEYSLPIEQRFWDDLMETASTWGVRIYEQDWLITEFQGLEALNTQVKLGRQWLMQMGAGAAKHGINIQYCMPLPRHVLQSVEIPNVVQVRASGDYRPSTEQWQIGSTSVLNYALGLAPFKDDFWTTSVQPGNPYNLTEEAPHLEAALATFSTGPVTPSDGIGYSNKTLISFSVRSDGLVLKPDRPMFSLTSMYVQRAFGKGGANGQVYSTYTEFNGNRFYMVLAAELKDAYSLTFDSLGITGKSTLYSWMYHDRYFDTSNVVQFSPTQSIALKPNAKSNMVVVYASPQFSNGITLLGEVNKWVPVSHQRFASMSSDPYSVTLGVIGAPHEVVQLSYINGGATLRLQCVLDSAGTSDITILAAGGYTCV